MDRLQNILNSSITSIIVSIVLVVASAQEVWTAVETEVSSLQSHHGILVFGIITLLKSVIQLIESFTKTHERIHPQKRRVM